MEFRRSKKGKAKKCFLRNGRRFLEELIIACNGISNPIRMFSSAQIIKATDHFDRKCYLPEQSHPWYKGDIEDGPYAIKKSLWYQEDREHYNDIALSARVSNHSCFLKLIGCCLEFDLPIMVFENPKHGVLNYRGSVGSVDGPLLPWNVRLKIAKEVAIAVTYLHTAFPRIIIHRDIKPSNVFLDENWKVKLTGFSISITLPEGKTWIEDMVVGTNGYIDPFYMDTGLVSEYSDVFSFGIFMLVLLISKPAVFAHWYILDYVKDLRERGEPVEFGGDLNNMKPNQMKMYLELALRCCEKRNEDIPKMILVAKEIKLIEHSLDC